MRVVTPSTVLIAFLAGIFILWQLGRAKLHILATCVNYAKIYNSMLCMRGHVSRSFFAVINKINTMDFVVLSQARKVNFLNR